MKLGCLLLTACAVGPVAHVGPVTATTTVGEREFSCSQVGVLESTPAGQHFVVNPGWRPFALSGRAAVGVLPALLLVGGGTPAQSGEVALCDLAGSVVTQRRVAEDLVYAVAIAPHEPVAAAACADGRVLLLALPDLSIAERTWWRHGGPAVAVAFSPDGELLASAGHDSTILIGRPADETAPRALLDHTAAVTCLAWAPEGQLASGSRDGKVRLHDRSGRLLHTWQRLGGVVTRVTFHAGQLEYGVEGEPGWRPVAGVWILP
ncbi:MAG: hypothetical protein ABIP94_08910 [Planctomycetota bacterium]